MRAVTYKKYGSVDNLIFDYGYPDPNIKDDEILIRVIASSINHVDILMRRGEFRLLGGFFAPRAHLLGRDFSGEVVESKEKNGLYKKGDKVFGVQFSGTSVELITVKPRMLSHAPNTINIKDAACYPLVTLTAIQAVKKLANLQTGQTILINGVGSVGSAAVYMARSLGASKIDVTSSKKNFASIKQLPVNEVFDYKDLEWNKLPVKYDVVYDAHGYTPRDELFKALKSGGVAVTTNPFRHLGELLTNKIRGGSKKFKANFAMPSHEGMIEVAKLIDEQGFRLKKAAEFSLDRYKQAHNKFEEGVEGKILILH
ncbi:MAG: Alcohol dehydrogenase zinc-binding domain protein [Candidatus Curtissbacteria bacterium GW2011_GWA1_41_11]|uniref:Alcohol dehydrogenase zinc-binding domain protein n=1 Tax=Candidatus Curtissbacteria bacterium GW2011_GWA1_41_11 TaxID=1618409 RepID=A0A0G0UDE8_9BACT|nr:MAG: Alcohol dehydrogenase zinc-binding domain protein [Candidatus Curtissbacteria bacterium GW2011_GWA1_41_11]